MEHEKSRFQAIAEYFRDQRRLLPSRDVTLKERVDEVASLLDELAVLDERVVQLTNQVVAEHKREVDALVQDAVIQSPEFAKLVGAEQHLELKGFSVGYTDARFAVPNRPELAPLHTQLQVDVSSFYDRAHRLTKLLRTIGAFRSFKCREIVVVRNHLLEHPDGRHGRGTLWSFG